MKNFACLGFGGRRHRKWNEGHRLQRLLCLGILVLPFTNTTVVLWSSCSLRHTAAFTQVFSFLLLFSPHPGQRTPERSGSCVLIWKNPLASRPSVLLPPCGDGLPGAVPPDSSCPGCRSLLEIVGRVCCPISFHSQRGATGCGRLIQCFNSSGRWCNIANCTSV